MSRWLERLHRTFFLYLLGCVVFLIAMFGLEGLGASHEVIGFVFLLATLVLYATVGFLNRTTNADEYYVAGRRIPAIYNGMATGADWMSAASFIGLAGTLYLQGYGGLAFVIGWCGGFCLVALLLAPFLRRFGQYTVPDFLAARYPWRQGRWMRLFAVMAVLLVSFTYVVAQIYGVGLITSRLSGVAFELGVFVGLGGMLVCSFLGGMRAVTWTQVAQYVVLIAAYVIPCVWLSVQQTHNPFPPFAYGYQLEKIAEKEHHLIHDPAELAVQQAYIKRLTELDHQLNDPQTAWQHDRQQALDTIQRLQKQITSPSAIAHAEMQLAQLPRTVEQAQKLWEQERQAIQLKMLPLGGMPPHEQAFAHSPHPDKARNNFLALIFCLMLGTAALPHILMRYYTVPNVAQARRSVSWSLFFIVLLYLCAPALAAMVKYQILYDLVGTPMNQLPEWVRAWQQVDAQLFHVRDMNHDGLLQFSEISLDGDIVMLAMPEIAGLPYVLSGLVAAGGLAAALSTADGLLLTIANALSHDVYYQSIDPKADTVRRVTISKVLLLMVALLAAYVAAQKPADIMFLVSAAFSLAASAFFPALVMGIFWKRANAIGALVGMVSGLALTIYYMVMNQPWLRSVFHVQQPIALWFDILPISAGLFGVPMGFLMIVVVSWLTPPPSPDTLRMVDTLRHGNLT